MSEKPVLSYRSGLQFLRLLDAGKISATDRQVALIRQKIRRDIIPMQWSDCIWTTDSFRVPAPVYDRILGRCYEEAEVSLFSDRASGNTRGLFLHRSKPTGIELMRGFRSAALGQCGLPSSSPSLPVLLMMDRASVNTSPVTRQILSDLMVKPIYTDRGKPWPKDDAERANGACKRLFKPSYDDLIHGPEILSCGHEFAYDLHRLVNVVRNALIALVTKDRKTGAFVDRYDEQFPRFWNTATTARYVDDRMVMPVKASFQNQRTQLNTGEIYFSPDLDGYRDGEFRCFRPVNAENDVLTVTLDGEVIAEAHRIDRADTITPISMWNILGEGSADE